MMSDREIQAAAASLLRAYGGMAWQEARLRCNEKRAAGDPAGYASWTMICQAVDSLATRPHRTLSR